MITSNFSVNPQSGSYFYCFQAELEFGMLDFEGGGKPDFLEKNLGARTGTNNKFNPHIGSPPGFEPGALQFSSTFECVAQALDF